ncbi:MAG: class I adenylate-forming enzyme family protein [Myxococcota bacterium]|jgi:long-chain acyl-CoA synthetase|nr:class I adenylate-forming enzyme family protein [Myxococcota bacterium]
MSEVPSWDQAVAALTTAEGSPFEIIEREVDGEARKVFANLPNSLREAFALCWLNEDKVFLVYEDETWTFSQVMRRVSEIGDALVNRYGVEPGDRVAIAMRNYPEWIMSFAAITSVGGIAVCMNAWWKKDEMAYGLEDSGAKVLIADSERIKVAEPSLGKFDVKTIGVRVQGELPSGVDRFEEILRAGAAMPEVEVGPEDDATILYTSGTTGFPKGAVSSHIAILAALRAFACRALVGAMTQPPKEPNPYEPCFILAVPLFHVTGLVPVMLSCFLNGIKLVIMYKWTPERALDLIERERVTQFVGVPTMMIDLLESPDFASRDTSSLSSVGGGGAPAPPEVVGRVDKSFARARPGLGYGMTETNAYGPQNAGDDYVRKPRSSGRSVPILEVKCFDDEMKPVGLGEVGEICFRGQNLIRGYWNKPEATAETIVNGWLRSGDLGRIDEEGFVFVEDRAKDMVLRAGENIYCAEVEAIIYESDDVHEAAVFGMPHHRLGEEVACAVMPKKGRSIDVEALVKHVGEKLAKFKVPTVIEVVSEPLPRNASGKILKRDIRDELVARRE